MSPVEPEQDPLYSSGFLPKEIETRLRNAVKVRSYQAGEVIFLQGEMPGGIYLIAHGQVKITRTSPEGFENILCMRGPGEYFCPVPLLDHDTQLGTAYAITDVTLFLTNQDEFCLLCKENSALQTYVLGDCLAEVRHLVNRLEVFAYHNIRERLALVLLDAVNRQQNLDRVSCPLSTPIELRLTQQELAGLVGGTRETVSRKLQELMHVGAISLSRGRVTICNWEKLKHAASPDNLSR